ncbi:MAG: hypothetical protein ABJC07_05415 [Acidobacteriota bacterium]
MAVSLAAPAPAAPRPVVRRPRPARIAARLSPDERISLDLKDADIRDVLRSFAELTGTSLVIDPDVKGSVTVCLHDVFWVDALEVILRSNGLGMVAGGRVLRVGAPARLAQEDPR